MEQNTGQHKTSFTFPYWFVIKIAGTGGLAAAVITYILLPLLFNHSVKQDLIFAGLLFLAVFLIIYFILRSQILSRLKTIETISANITQKKFKNYRSLIYKNDDELDELVSQCREASKTMEREIERLNKIENYRKEFIGDVSHELKTPIFAIQGFLETLLDGAIDDEQVNREFLKKARKHTNRLTYLTKDLMEISKLETGERKSEKDTLNLSKLLTEVIENLQHQAEEEGVLIQTKSLDDSVSVIADRHQIRQVLINLIENAIKYNKIGGLVTVSAEAYSKNSDKILVSVEDTGIGIEQEYLERITERFFRIDKSRSRQKGGTGLGMAIVKHIIEAHGEELFMASTPGEGSTFSFTLQKAGV